MAAVTGRAYVRVCPVCETENSPDRARCACGALLTGVDFSIKREAAPHPDRLATPRGEGAQASPQPAHWEQAQTLPRPAEPREGAGDGKPTLTLTCPHPDCAQPNPPGETRCVYCDRPLTLEPPRTTVAGTRPLPAALAREYRIIEAFPVSGSEADLYLVEHLQTHERCVAKLYRKGLEPDFRLLSLLTQALGDAVVRVISHGVSEGVAYELLEYIPGGTLQDVMRAGPLPRDDIVAIVRELADALNGIHAQHILHRDIKPENVLVRSRAPLRLALTDFGISSLAEATQHFTSAARTTKYAAPEALIGVIDEKADWWSLGMIVLEAAAGRHPFDGLNEHVINHHLATRPIDVRGVYDDELRKLCRGLLLRDPKRRWSGDEVRRWLAGDPALTAPEETAGGAARPYRIGSSESTTVQELALALAKHWEEAKKDLVRGQIASWLEHELHDHNLLRKLRDVLEHRALSDDARLLRFLVAAAPDLPPVWQGQPVSDAAILAAARRAIAGDAAAQSWLDSLYRDGALTVFPGPGHDDLREIDRWWRESWDHFIELWHTARKAELDWRKKPRAVAGFDHAEVVSYDDVMYGATMRMTAPAQATVNASLLLAQADAGYVAGLRGEITAVLAEVSGYCDWFEALHDKAADDPVAVLVMHRLMKPARDDAAQEKHRLGVSQEARARIVEDARRMLRERLEALLAVAPEARSGINDETAQAMLDAVPPLQEACQNALRLSVADHDCSQIHENAERISAAAASLQRALGDYEHVRSLNRIFMRPQRLAIAAFVLFLLVGIRAPVVALVLLVVALVAILYRLNLDYRATERIALHLRSLRNHGSNL